MIPVSTLYDEYIDRPKLTEQKKNPFEYIDPPPFKRGRNKKIEFFSYLFYLYHLLREGIIDCYIVEIIWYSIVKYKKIEILIQMFLVFRNFRENYFQFSVFWNCLSNGFYADFELAQNLKK